MNPDKVKKKATGQPSSGAVLTSEATKQIEEELLSQQARKTSLTRTPPGRAPGVDVEEAGESTTEKDTDKELNKDDEVEQTRRKRKNESPKGQRAKRSNLSEDEDDGCEDEVEVDDPLVNIMTKLLRMQAKIEGLHSKSKSISKATVKYYASETDAIRKYVHQSMEERAYLRGRLDEREEIKTLIKGNTGTRPRLAEDSEVDMGTDFETFAEVTKRRKRRVPAVSGLKGPPRTAINQVVITATGKDAGEVERKLKESVDPARLGIQVRKIFRTRRGLVVQCERSEDIDKLKRAEELKREGLDIKVQDKKSPTIMIYDVEKRDDEEILEEIYRKNLMSGGMSEDEFKAEFKVRYKYKQRAQQGPGRHRMERENWVVECSGLVRNLLRSKGRVYVGWESCRIKDYIDVVRCYKCQWFGHVAKVCEGKETCGKCAEMHPTKECKVERNKSKCTNCEKDGLDHKHDAGWRLCPTYLKVVDRYLEKVDYGS